MKSTIIKTFVGLALTGTTAVVFAAGTGCCASIECCLKMLGCC